MKQGKLKLITRILLIVGGFILAFTLLVPIWRIDLIAPQYPEGLSLFIHANKLSGNVDIINGLNHYIGMKVLKEEDFVEFKVLPYIIILFSLLFMLTAIVARRRMLTWLLILFALFGIVAMYDFWRWEYDYGHNLDPNAAIKVPGMSYQPPLIGYKQLLNFEAYSIPSTGGCLFLTAGLLIVVCLIIEKYSNMKKKRMNVVAILMLLMSIPFLNACNKGPEAIDYGKDNCHYCKMTISDNRYGAELVSKKGRTFKFDDSVCLIEFVKDNAQYNVPETQMFLASFSEPVELLNVQNAILFSHEALTGPMNGEITAFRNEDELNKVKSALNGEGAIVSWSNLLK